MARTAYYTYTWDDTGATFDFADGTTVELEWAQLNDETKLRLMAHGLKQKTIDAGAIPCDTLTGRPATQAEKITASTAVFHRVAANQWTAPRESGGRQAGGMLLAALCQLSPNKPREDIAAWLKGKSKAEQAALRADPRIAPIIAEMKAARVSDIDTDAMLAGLGV